MPKYSYRTIPAVPAKKVRVYRYEDLPEEAKVDIRKRYDYGMDGFAFECLQDGIEYQLKEAGLPSFDIYINNEYSWNVGFYGSILGSELTKLCETMKFKLPKHDIEGEMFTDNLTISFRNPSYRKSISLEIDIDYPNEWKDADNTAHILWKPLVAKLKDALDKFWHDKCGELEKQCNAEEDYRNSEQYVIDQTEGNWYTKEGEGL
jgi:hypothetical protein